MTNMAKWQLALFVLLFVNNSSIEAIFTMNETCHFYPQGYIADPDDCQSWGYCESGALQRRGKCGNGFLYDTAKGMCNYAWAVQCGNTAEKLCASSLERGYTAVPNDCNQYCYCFNQKVLECSSCPPNQRFNPKARKCQYDYECPRDSVCRLVKNNAFVASPTNCGEFIRCLDGSGVSSKCTHDYYFSPTTGYCQQNNPCLTSIPGDNNPTVTNPTDPSKCTKYNVEEGGIQYLADDKTCYGYYTCTSSVGKGTWRSCPFGLHFNYITKQCVSPNSFSCTKDRCGNINISFATVPFKNCMEYYVCNNNSRSANTYNCPSSFPFFDEFNQACVAEPPNNAICAASVA